MTYAPVSCFRSAKSTSATHTIARRDVLRLGAASAATGILAHASFGQAFARQAGSVLAPEPFEGVTFVGETSDPDLFVALVLGTDEARAYLCDGRRNVVWFSGPAGNTLHMTAINGSELSAYSTVDAIEGEATLADGSTVTFAAAPASSIGGLYEIVVNDGRVAGAAAGDRRFDGIVVGALPDGTLLIAGVVAVPEAGMRPLAVFSTPDAAGEQRWIILEDGRVTGAAKTDRGTGFIDPTSDLLMPTEEIHGNIISPRD
jgi:hypothetical protein